MGWTTKEESVKVLSRETVEDRNPKLYIKRAQELAKMGKNNAAKREYDKAIEFSGKELRYYISKLFFLSDIQEHGEAASFLLIVIWKKASFLYWFAAVLMIGFINSISDFHDKYVWQIISNNLGRFLLICSIMDFSLRIVITIHKKIKIKWLKYVVRFAVFIGVIAIQETFSYVTIINVLGWLYVIYMLKTVLELITDIFKYLSSKKHLTEEFLSESAFNESEFYKKGSSESVVSSNMQYPKQEQLQINKVLQQDIAHSQKTLQRETSFTSAYEGMLLVLDVPIQRGKLFLDKFVIEKNIVTIPVNGKSLQVDVSCKKIETKPDANLGKCKRYDIKKGTVVYVFVAVIEYCINIWSKEWDENTESTCEKLTVQLNKKLDMYGVKTRLSKRGWLFLENDKLITFEDVIYLLCNKEI